MTAAVMPGRQYFPWPCGPRPAGDISFAVGECLPARPTSAVMGKIPPAGFGRNPPVPVRRANFLRGIVCPSALMAVRPARDRLEGSSLSPLGRNPHFPVHFRAQPRRVAPHFSVFTEKLKEAPPTRHPPTWLGGGPQARATLHYLLYCCGSMTPQPSPPAPASVCAPSQQWEDSTNPRQQPGGNRARWSRAGGE